MNAFADSTAVVSVVLWAAIPLVALYVWTALALAAVFRKSGEAAWQAWVPILNQVVLFRLGGQSPWFLLFLLLPGVGALVVWIVQILACHRINTAFQFGGGMTVLAALFLPVWASVVGFGSSRWVGEEEAAGPRRAESDRESAAEPHIGRTAPADVAMVDEPLGAAAFHGRSTHVAAPDPLFSTSSEAVAPPAPAPGRPTPFAPTARIEEAPAGPIPPRAVRAGSPVPAPPGGWAPAPAHPDADSDIDADPDDSAPPRRRSAFEALPEDTGEVTGAVPGAPAPMAAVPSASPSVTRVPAATMRPPVEAWAPARSAEPEGFAESSGPVSAIVGAPDAGSPRSARASVSAQSRRPQIPDDPLEETVIARRRRTDWSLVPPAGAPVAIGADVVLLGRRPVPDAAYPGAQLISIDDGTVSKTHALLELRDDKWYVTDLDSTNGVVFATLLGTEVEATPRVAIEAGDRFLLGDAEVRLVRSSE